VDDDIADLLADLGAAGLAGGNDRAADLLQVLGEVGDLRGLAAAFGALEGDEDAARDGGAGSGGGPGRFLWLFHRG